MVVGYVRWTSDGINIHGCAGYGDGRNDWGCGHGDAVLRGTAWARCIGLRHSGRVRVGASQGAPGKVWVALSLHNLPALAATSALARGSTHTRRLAHHQPPRSHVMHVP